MKASEKHNASNKRRPLQGHPVEAHRAGMNLIALLIGNLNVPLGLDAPEIMSDV